MSDAVIHTIVELLGVAALLIGAARIAGKVEAKVDATSTKVDAHRLESQAQATRLELRMTAQDAQLSSHGQRLAHIEGRLGVRPPHDPDATGH